MTPELSTASVVIIGQFNVDDFLPKELVKNEVIAPDDFSGIEWNTYVPAQVLDINLPWGKFVVTPNQLIGNSNQAPYIIASDLVRSALSYAQSYKIFALGLNFEAHFKLAYSHQRDTIGKRLAPPDAWGAWGLEVKHQMETSVAADRMSGMNSITMRKSLLDLKGVFAHTDVRVGASIPYHETGVHIVVNNHFQCERRLDYSKLNNPELVDYKETLLDIIEEKFDKLTISAQSIMDGILEVT